MKRNTICGIAAVLTSALLLGCQKKPLENSEAHNNHPGNSPQLVIPVESTNRVVVSNQSTVRPAWGRQAGPVIAYGFISLDETRSNQVAARLSGRVEKLYVKFENQYVRKGEKIMDLYSVDLNTWQEELLYAQKIDPDGELPKHAAHKLNLLGVADDQIRNIINSGKTSFTLSVYSPYNGYIFYTPSASLPQPKRGIAPGGGNKMGGMPATASGVPMGSAPMGSPGGQVREGAYVSTGQTLFWINDLRQVWGILSVDNLHQHRLSLRDSTEVISELAPESPFHTTIRFIEPIYTSGQKFVQARVYLPNNNMKLRVNSLLQASIHPKAGNLLTLPASSILYLGGRQAVWKKTGQTAGGSHVFEIHFVSLGPVSQGHVVVLEGLKADDEVALDAGFLIDRESLIKPE